MGLRHKESVRLPAWALVALVLMAPAVAASAPERIALDSIAPTEKNPEVETSTPTIRLRDVSIGPGIPREVVRNIARQNYGRFRLCYEKALERNPALRGTISVHFLIEQNGSVSNLQNTGSDLSDATAVDCIVNAFSGLSFPKPEGSPVKVLFQVWLTPPSKAADDGKRRRQ